MNTTIFKRILLSSAATVATLSAAYAADLPNKKDPVPPIMAACSSCSTHVHDWSGFYMGALVGYNKFNDTVTMPNQPAWVYGSPYGDPVNDWSYDLFDGAFRVGDSLNGGGAGFSGGLEFGWNYQCGNAVLGIEADYSLLSASGSQSLTRTVGENGTEHLGNATASSRLNSLGTIRGRLGAAFGDALLYATAGLAFGHVKSTLHDSYLDGTDTDPSNASINAYQQSGMRFGWTAGAGAEYALTSNISLKAEALYYDLGSKKGAINPELGYTNYAGGTYTEYKDKANGEVVRVGLNYKF